MGWGGEDMDYRSGNDRLLTTIQFDTVRLLWVGLREGLFLVVVVHEVQITEQRAVQHNASVLSSLQERRVVMMVVSVGR